MGFDFFFSLVFPVPTCVLPVATLCSYATAEACVLLIRGCNCWGYCYISWWSSVSASDVLLVSCTAASVAVSDVYLALCTASFVSACVVLLVLWSAASSDSTVLIRCCDCWDRRWGRHPLSWVPFAGSVPYPAVFGVVSCPPLINFDLSCGWLVFVGVFVP